MEETAVVREQLALFEPEPVAGEEESKTFFNDPAFASNKDLPVHRWVPWIAGFSSDFVQHALGEYLDCRSVVLDPFAGVGTTLVEALHGGHDAIGFEINPYAALACEAKVAARKVAPDALQEHIERFDRFLQEGIAAGREPGSTPPEGFRTRSAFYSSKVMRKVLLIWDYIGAVEEPTLRSLFRLAFAATMVRYSNYTYEPSLGTRRGAGKEDIEDYAVRAAVVDKLQQMHEDIVWLQQRNGHAGGAGRVVQDSFFNARQHLASESVDLIVTSPPYLNNYHYIRNTRPHLYWLGFAEKPKDTKPIEHANFGKFWQTVRSKDHLGLSFDLPKSDLAERLDHLRTLNPEKGVYGGNGWANYAAAYFNDCHRFAQSTQHVLKPGATALVVIGNSILQGVHIATDQYLGQIAERVGLELVDIHIPRATRVGNSIIQSDVRVGKAKNGKQLYEAVVELRKP